MKVRTKTYNQQCQEIINDFLSAHPDIVDWQMEDVAAWAVRTKRWHPPRSNTVKLCARHLSQAAREEYFTDDHGRRVRKKHARRETVLIDGKPKQLVFWADIRTAEPRHMRVSLQQRRGMVLADCAQLKRDTDCYNETNAHGAQILMSYDFTEDLIEMELPPDYDGSES